MDYLYAYRGNLVPIQAFANDNEGDTELYSVYVACRLDEAGKHSAPIKVGYSKDFFRRRAAIQTACPFPIVIAWTFDFEDRQVALEVEKSFHCFQRANRLYGEWFVMDVTQAIAFLCKIIRAIIGYNSPSLDMVGVLSAEGRISRDMGWLRHGE